jgi:hypothetical protein
VKSSLEVGLQVLVQFSLDFFRIARTVVPGVGPGRRWATRVVVPGLKTREQTFITFEKHSQYMKNCALKISFY